MKEIHFSLGHAPFSPPRFFFLPDLISSVSLTSSRWPLRYVPSCRTSVQLDLRRSPCGSLRGWAVVWPRSWEAARAEPAPRLRLHLAEVSSLRRASVPLGPKSFFLLNTWLETRWACHSYMPLSLSAYTRRPSFLILPYPSKPRPHGGHLWSETLNRSKQISD